MKEIFSKPLPYRDWKGLVTAENAKLHDLQSWLKQRRLIGSEEIALGIELDVRADASVDDGYIRNIRAYVVSHAGQESVQQTLDGRQGPLRVRVIDLSLSEREFLSLFNRLSLRMSFHGMLNGVECETFTDIVPDESR
jgi:hypothetical protein